MRSGYQKIIDSCSSLECFFVDALLESHAAPPEEIVLDFGATDAPRYRHQLGRFFQGYYPDYSLILYDGSPKPSNQVTGSEARSTVCFFADCHNLFLRHVIHRLSGLS